MSKKFLFLLMNGPYTHQDSHSVIKLSQAAIKFGHVVHIHLYVDGVYNASKFIQPKQPERELDAGKEFSNLVRGGATLTLCPNCAAYRGVTEEQLIPGAKMMSLPEFVLFIREADIFITWGLC